MNSTSFPAARRALASPRLSLPAFLLAGLVALVALSSAACGQRGPLYLPEQAPPAADAARASAERQDTEEQQDENEGNDEKTPGT